jgi:hypothetical protein
MPEPPALPPPPMPSAAKPAPEARFSRTVPQFDGATALTLVPDFDAEMPTVLTPLPDEPLPTRWAPFEKLGLGLPKLDPMKLQKHTVNAYRVLGFGILTIIVAILVGYIAQTTFFYLSSSWIVPMAVSPTDDKVLAAQEQLAAQQNNRDKIAADLADAERAIGMQQAFQAEYTKTIKSDLSDARLALERMQALAVKAAATREHIKATNNAFAESSAQKMAEEYRAGLIDRHEMLNGKFQLAQVTNSNLSLAERQADYEVKATDLDSQARSLEALLGNQSSDVPLSYEVLKIKQDFETSKLLMQKSVDLRDALKQSLEREDKLIATLKSSSYLRALNDHAQAAFVPYDNLKGIEKDTPVYACKLTMVFCHKAGRVVDVLQGEVQFKHPQRDKMLRGQMVELDLEDGAAANDVLFVGGRPLVF